MNPDNPNSDLDSNLLTSRELAEKMGLSPVHGPRTIGKMVKAGRIPAIRLNSRDLRFHWPSVLAKLTTLK
jgi:hypothetical protein